MNDALHSQKKKKQKTRQQQHEAHVVTIETFTRDEIVEKKGSLYIYKRIHLCKTMNGII